MTPLAFRRAVITLYAIRSAENGREVGGCILRYSIDHQGKFPETLGQLALEQDSDFQPNLLIVPGGRSIPASGTPQQIAAQIDGGGHCSYVYVGAGLTTDTVRDGDVIMYESRSNRPLGGRIYCLYGDGHGESSDAADLFEYVVQNQMKELSALRRPKTQPVKKTHAATQLAPAPTQTFVSP